MKYMIIVTNEEGNKGCCDVDAIDARAAHAMIDDLPCATTGTVRVYPCTLDTNGYINEDGVMFGALMVARRTAANALRRTGGSETQRRIDRELSAIAARCKGMSAIRMAEILSEYSSDTQDFVDIAATGLIDAIDVTSNIEEQYHAAFLALNKHVHRERAATEYELSTEFICDGGGDIVSINAAISSIIRGGEKWIPSSGSNMDAATAARLGNAIHKALMGVRPAQRDIARMLAQGYSQRQIAEKTDRGLATINRNIAIMRDNVAKYIHENAPEFSDMIDNMMVMTAADRATKDCRSEDAKARKAESDKATQAERARRYRARKAAGKTARQDG